MCWRVCGKRLKKQIKIYLATDPDREGEAISWHLMKALKLDEQKDKKVYRISFNEITKNAVKASLKEPRAIDDKSGGCTAGETYARPYGGLPHQPASLGEGQKRTSAPVVCSRSRCV